MCRTPAISDITHPTSVAIRRRPGPKKGYKKGYLLLEGKRVWCVICADRFAVFTHDSEGEENRLFDLELKSVDVERLIIVNSTSSSRQSRRRELPRGSHVVSWASSDRTDAISANNPLLLRARAPALDLNLNAPAKQVLGQCKSTRANVKVFGQSKGTHTKQVFRQKSAQTKQVLGQTNTSMTLTQQDTPGFVIQALSIKTDMGQNKVHLTLNCTAGQSNVDAAEWVDSLVRARGESIRHAGRTACLHDSGPIHNKGRHVLKARSKDGSRASTSTCAARMGTTVHLTPQP
jgi:hypothetical protein